jgi:hypothetical protein
MLQQLGSSYGLFDMLPLPSHDMAQIVFFTFVIAFEVGPIFFDIPLLKIIVGETTNAIIVPKTY